jgi:hypothetical protein
MAIPWLPGPTETIPFANAGLAAPAPLAFCPCASNYPPGACTSVGGAGHGTLGSRWGVKVFPWKSDQDLILLGQELAARTTPAAGGGSLGLVGLATSCTHV